MNDDPSLSPRNSRVHRRAHAVVRPAAILCAWLLSLLLAMLFSTTQLGVLTLGLLLSSGRAIAWGTSLGVVVLALYTIYVTRQRRRVATAVNAFAPTVAVAVLLLGGSPMSGRLRFQLARANYEHVARDAQQGRCAVADRAAWTTDVDVFDCTPPAVVIFAWGGLGSAWYGVVFDAEDQIIVPPSGRSSAWKQRDVGALLSCSTAATSLGDHYYLANGSYVAGVDGCG